MPTITGIQVFPLRHPKLKAHATIVLDECFVISGLRIVDGCNGLFVAMPVGRRGNGQYEDFCYPTTREFNRYLEQNVLTAYRKLSGGKHLSDAAIYAGA